jgi:hypothetical protein
MDKTKASEAFLRVIQYKLFSGIEKVILKSESVADAVDISNELVKQSVTEVLAEHMACIALGREVANSGVKIPTREQMRKMTEAVRAATIAACDAEAVRQVDQYSADPATSSATVDKQEGEVCDCPKCQMENALKEGIKKDLAEAGVDMSKVRVEVIRVDR